jgi:hypothetical protein
LQTGLSASRLSTGSTGSKTVTDLDFDPTQGSILPTGKAFGKDTGLQYSIDITSDVIRGQPLDVAQTYYYTVNAYAVGLGQVPQVLESANNPITVVPQTPAGGIDLNSVQVSAIAQAQYAAGPIATTDVVTVNTIDPIQVKNASYLVGFKPCGACPTGRAWYVVRTLGAAVDTVVNNWTDFDGNQQHPVFDGLQVTHMTYPPAQLARVQ